LITETASEKLNVPQALSLFVLVEGANAVAEVGDRKPATLAEGKPSASMAMVPDVLTAGEPDALAEERTTPQPVSRGGVLIPAQRNPNEWCGQAF
jgi:hypothetical protein